MLKMALDDLLINFVEIANAKLIILRNTYVIALR